jgi:hypothetical protein
MLPCLVLMSAPAIHAGNGQERRQLPQYYCYATDGMSWHQSTKADYHSDGHRPVDWLFGVWRRLKCGLVYLVLLAYSLISLKERRLWSVMVGS